MNEEFDSYTSDVELHEKYSWVHVQIDDLSKEESAIRNQVELSAVQLDENLRFIFQLHWSRMLWTDVKKESNP